MTIDLHQHLWPPALVELLSGRDRPPRLRDSVLELATEGSHRIDLDDHRLGARLALLDRAGIDTAVVSLQPTLGIAELPPDEAAELLGAYEQGILEVAAESGGRIVPLSASSDRRAGFAGSCVAAARLVELEGLAPMLDDLAERGEYLFVHPGAAAQPPPNAPAWWASVVDYTAQMQAAYATWLAVGAARWPELRVVFAILAGGAPFQLERLRASGVAGRDVLYETVFFETSSYGNRALELCLSTFGVSQLVFGSDVPVLDPEPGLDAIRGFGDAVYDTLCDRNPSRLLASAA